MIPTVGFNMRKVSKGNVTIKVRLPSRREGGCVFPGSHPARHVQLWDIGGQPRFRSMWERYCRGVRSAVYYLNCAEQSSGH